MLTESELRKESFYEYLRIRAKEFKRKTEQDTGRKFLGGKCKDLTTPFGLLVLHVNEHGNLMKVELPNGALIDPSFSLELR